MPEESSQTQTGGIKKAGRPVRKTRPAGDAGSAVKNSSKEEGSGFKSVLILLMVGIVVGGAVYGWQKTSKDSLVEDLKKASDSAKSELEKKLTVLDNQIKGFEKENETLKQTNEELKSKAELLSGAVKKYNNDELGLYFEYPAEYGEVKVEKKDGTAGSSFLGTFSTLDSLVFGGASKDFATKEMRTFLNMQGYEKKKKDDKDIFAAKYGWLPEKEVEFKPVKMIKADIAFVNAGSFPGQPASAVASSTVSANGSATTTDTAASNGFLGQNEVGAIINLKKPAYGGLVFLSKDPEKLSQETFDKLLNTINVK